MLGSRATLDHYIHHVLVAESPPSQYAQYVGTATAREQIYQNFISDMLEMKIVV